MQGLLSKQDSSVQLTLSLRELVMDVSFTDPSPLCSVPWSMYSKKLLASDFPIQELLAGL